MALILRGSAIDLDNQQKLGMLPLDYIMLNLPYSCNYRCLKCCNQTCPSNGRRLKISQIADVLEQLKVLGARVLVIAGEGEPVMDQYFREIVSVARQLNMLPYVFTNGSLIDETLAEWLVGEQVTLVINVDAFEEGLYDELVGIQGSFDVISQRLLAIRRHYRNLLHRLPDGLYVTSLALNLVLNKKNADQVEKIREFCGDEIVFVVNEPIQKGAAAENPIFQSVSVSQKSGISYPLGTLRQGQECAYLRYGLSIGADGSILACAYALDTAGKFGNILSTTNILEVCQTVQESVDEFYKRRSSSRCLLRHPCYEEFVNKKGVKI